MFIEVDEVTDGMYARLMNGDRVEFDFVHEGHIGVGIVRDAGGIPREPDRYVTCGKDGAPLYNGRITCWRRAHNYGPGYRWEQYIGDKEYSLDQELDESEDLL